MLDDDLRRRAEDALADYEEPLGWTLREDRLMGLVRDLLAEVKAGRGQRKLIRLARDCYLDERDELQAEVDALQAKIDAVREIATDFARDDATAICDILKDLGEQ